MVNYHGHFLAHNGPVWGFLGGLLSFTCDSLWSRSSVFAGTISAPRPGVREKATLSGDILVHPGQQVWWFH
jgi:hypothetical protein